MKRQLLTQLIDWEISIRLTSTIARENAFQIQNWKR